MIKLFLTEAQEQELVIAWARANQNYCLPLKRLFHIPNGGKRDKAEAAHFKRLGVQAGVSDLLLPYPCGDYHGLFIEMKSEKGKLSKAQADFLYDMAQWGYRAVVCYNADEAIKEIIKYLGDEWYE